MAEILELGPCKGTWVRLESVGSWKVSQGLAVYVVLNPNTVWPPLSEAMCLLRDKQSGYRKRSKMCYYRQ